MMMTSYITIANAKEHCRTCLCLLTDYMEQTAISQLDNIEMTTVQTTAASETQNACVFLNNNKDMHSFLTKCLAIKSPIYNDHNLEYPQKVCLGCYTKLQDFEKFINKASASAEKLHTIFNINKAAIKDKCLNATTIQPLDTTSPNTRSDSCSMSTILIKDDLLEMESIILPAAHIERTDDNMLETQDPFEPILDKTISPINTDFKYSPVKSPQSIVKTTAKPRKRRTKQEMEELHKTLIILKAKRAPRRKKGLKNTFKCSQCNHSFAHKITLDAHIRKIHEGLKRAYKCDRCDKSYTFVGGLYNHIKENHNNANRCYQCDYSNCDRVYSSPITLQRHKLMKHSNAQLESCYVCEQCGDTFSHYTNLKYHIKTRHPTEEQLAAKAQNTERYICHICQKEFYSRYTLKYHSLQLHSSDMKYECKVCGRRMAKKFMLMQHMLVHSADTEKLPCHHCNRKFIRKFELDSHIKAVHMKLKPYECQYCTECFASRKTLRHHEYIHTGEKPYVCNICGQSYRQQTALKNHRKTHEKNNSQTLPTNTIPCNRFGDSQ